MKYLQTLHTFFLILRLHVVRVVLVCPLLQYCSCLIWYGIFESIWLTSPIVSCLSVTCILLLSRDYEQVEFNRLAHTIILMKSEQPSRGSYKIHLLFEWRLQLLKLGSFYIMFHVYGYQLALEYCYFILFCLLLESDHWILVRLSTYLYWISFWESNIFYMTIRININICMKIEQIAVNTHRIWK